MRAYLIRLGGYLALSLGLGLLVPAWFSLDQRLETSTHSTLLLTALPAHDRVLAPVCPGPPVELAPAQMSPYPGLAGAAGSLEAAHSVAIPEEEYLALAGRLNQDPVAGFCLRLGERIYYLWPSDGAPPGRAYLRLVGLTPAGAADAPALSGEELAKSPHLAAFVENLDHLAQRAWDRSQRRETRSSADQLEAIHDSGRHGPFRGMAPTDIPPTEWRTALEQAGAKWDQERLRAGRYLLIGVVRKTSATVPVPVPGMRLGRVLAGALLLALGLWIMRGLYARRPGFMVRPGRAALLGDALFAVAGGVGAYALWELLFTAWLGVVPMLGETTQAVMALMLLPCLVVLSAYNTRAYTQGLVVTEDGVTRWGPAGGRYLPWKAIAGFSLRQTRLLVARPGLPAPRRLRTRLVIHSGRGELTLDEPGSESTKRSILNALEGLAPDRLVEDIAALRGKW